MKILYFTRQYTTHDHRFLSALAETEHQVAYMRLEQGSQVLEARSLPPQIEQVQWAGGNGPATWKQGGRLLLNLKRVLRQVQPELALAGPIQRTAFLTALVGFRPLVSMSWGYDLLHDAERGFGWRMATRFTLRRSAVMVGDCQTIREKGVAYGMPDERIVTFPWGIDLSHFSPAGQRQPEPGVFTLLSTRGWEPIYGVDVIAQAFVMASRRLAEAGGPRLRLFMLGGGSQAAALRQIFMRGGVLESVHFPGQVGYAELPRYYRSADLYLSASHSDGTSISLLEALACGCPALVSDIPGNREWVTPGENGWWFQDGNAAELCERILEAVVERERLPAMRSAARSTAEARGDWSQNFKQLLRAFELARQVSR